MSDSQNAVSTFGLGNYGGNASIFGANQLLDVLGLVQSRLQQAANSSDLFAQVFGDKANTAEIQAMRSQWSVGDFSQLPSVQILGAANFNNAVGAYASSSQTVYLSDALLQDRAAPLDSFLGATGILVEETFHWLDSLVGADTQGDEGELARVLVFGESVSNTELNRIKQEDDHGFINVSGQSVSVEQAGTNVTVEAFGNTKLLKDESKLLSAQVGSNAAIAIKYNGSQIYTGIFAGWETVAVETVGGQNQVLWKNAASNSTLVWNMDSNWNYLSSGSTFALNSGGALIQETNFGVDINGDSFVGAVNLEWKGNTKLVKDASNSLYAQLGNNTPISIKYNGSQIYTGIFAGWETVAVENVGGQNQVLWKNAGTNSALVWNMDSNWNYLYSGNTLSLNSTAALTQETNFSFDLNGNGYIGFASINVEAQGNTKLLKDGANLLSAQVGSNAAVAVKYNGSQIYTGIFAGWETVAVETVYGQNQVLWKNAGTNSALVWAMDNNWNYLSSYNKLALDSTGSCFQEINFNVDLNRDNRVGFPISSSYTAIEGGGNTSLIKDPIYNLLYAQVGGIGSSNPQIAIKYNGSQISTTTFAGWETLAVEIVGGQNQVLWKNAASNSTLVWNMDSNWNYVSSGSTFALNSAAALVQELYFGPGTFSDLNGDGFWGIFTSANSFTYVNAESFGNTKLVKDQYGLLSTQVGSNTAVAIKYGGSQIYTGIFAGWETVAVENVGGQNQVLWKNAASNSTLVWNMDSNWNFVSAGSTFALNSGGALIQETNFGVDLNGDSFVGVVNLEWKGNRKLVKDASNSLYAQLGNNTPISIKYNGSQISTTIFAGWETVAVESVGGQNQVLWKNAANYTTVVWNMDSNWNYLSSGSTFALNTIAGLNQENIFGVDLNGDDLVGVIDWYSLNLRDGQVSRLTRNLATDGNLSRNDMIAISQNTEDGGVIDAYELTDLRTIVANSSLFAMQDYVKVLSNKIANSDPANDRSGFGNLFAGSNSTQMQNLINKWFLGLDRPDLTDSSYVYNYTSGSLFQNGISYTDVNQGAVGDCYFLAGLANTAFRSASTIQNMFIDNGDNTYTVRFYNNNVADYVTVDRYLPTASYGGFVYAHQSGSSWGSYNNSSNELWVMLAEKAYAQMNESGWLDGAASGIYANSYSSIASGYGGGAIKDIAGGSTTYTNLTTSDFSSIVNAFKAGQMVYFSSKSTIVNTSVVNNHGYALVGYNSSTQKFTLYNPWGVNGGTSNGSFKPGYLDLSINELVANFDGWDCKTA